MNIERGVAIHMHLRHSPDDSNSKYIGFVGFTHSVSVISEIPYLASLALIRRIGVAWWDLAHVPPRILSCIHTKFKVYSSKGWSGQSTILVFFPSPW